MSRIGNKPIKVPSEVKVEINGTVVTLKKGDQVKTYDFGDEVVVKFENGELHVIKANDNEVSTKFVGLHRSNLNNIIKGLVEGYKIVLEYNGVGYKALVSKQFLVLTLGYSHDIALKIPSNIQVTPEKPNLISLVSNDKMAVGMFADRIRSLRRTEPYKGKGIKYQGETILRKQGKKK